MYSSDCLLPACNTAQDPFPKLAKVSSTPLSLIRAKPGEQIVHIADPSTQPHQRLSSKQMDLSSRAVVIADESDIVVSREIDPEYLNWLKEVGLKLPTLLTIHSKNGESIIDTLLSEPRLLKDSLSGKPVVTPFYSGERESRLADLLNGELFGSPETTVTRYFDKELFRTLCIELGIQVAHGQTVSRGVLEHALRDPSASGWLLGIMTLSGKVIMRGTSGSAGSSVFFGDITSLSSIAEKIASSDQDSYLVESFIPHNSSPNDQWIIGRNGEVKQIGVSRQILSSALKHIGNISNTELNLVDRFQIDIYSRKIVSEMAHAGYVGVLGIDYLRSPLGIFAVENNARFNGSTYAYMLLEKLFGHSEVSWCLIKGQTRPSGFRELKLELGKLIFNPNRKSGVFPIEISSLKESGEFTALICSEEPSEFENMYRAFMLQNMRQLPTLKF